MSKKNIYLVLIFSILNFSFNSNYSLAQEVQNMDEEETSYKEDNKNDDTNEISDQSTENKDENSKYEDYEDESEKKVDNPNLNNQVKFFDIVGIKLGDNYPALKPALKTKKYKLVNIEYDVPEYFKYNYDAACRKRNIFVLENIRACIKGLAKKRKMEYISKVNYKKHDTNEELSVYLTSPVTQNRVWKIEYKNNSNKKYGDSKNFQYQREEERRAFWYSVIMKYGKPTKEPNKWEYDKTDEHTIRLTANYGSLILENPKQNAYDILEATKQARREYKYTKYTF